MKEITINMSCICIGFYFLMPFWVDFAFIKSNRHIYFYIKKKGAVNFQTSVFSQMVRLAYLAAYKKADGKKIDGRRVLIDVERGRTVKGWRPRRLGGGLGSTRKGGNDVNTKYSGRDDFDGRDRYVN